jgi:solute carrier family 8 (sodium/calcium exchanger)
MVNPACIAVELAGLSFSCANHVDCCLRMAEESVYPEMDSCKFASYEDHEWAQECCSDEAMAVLGNGLKSLCLDQYGDAEPCEYSDPRICCPGGGGLLLPLFRSEVEWFVGARTVLYGFFLAYMLLGIMLISDIFMAAIEEITGQEVEKTIVNSKGETSTASVKVWNDTMANLTLMALGSSAPEILLSVVELFQQNFYSGRLGSSTIVGSAAFNLFVITAVCISSIPAGEVRYIAEVPVYCVTLTWSLLAYIWVLVVVQINTPEMVDIWEAIATLGGMPILLAMAFAADKGKICGCVAIDDDRKVSPGGDDTTALVDGVVPGGADDEEARDEIARILKHCQDKYGDRAEEKAVERIIKLKASSAHIKSRAYYRVLATRGMVGGQRALKRTITAHGAPLSSKVRKSVAAMASDGDDDEGTIVIEFAAPFYSCLESEGSLEVHVIRSGPTDNVCQVHYKTRDGTAIAGEDFTFSEGDLIFQQGEVEAIIEIPIIDDDSHEPDEDFFIDLSNPSSKGLPIKLGEVSAAVVTIIDDDDPGVLYFAEDDFFATEAEGVAKIWVARKDGCSANVSCMYYTQDGTAVEGKDYEEKRGRIEFLKGETRKNIDIKILNDVKYKKDVLFKVYLEHPTGGAKFEAKSGDQCLTTVHVSEAKSNQSKIDSLYKHMRTMMTEDEVKLGKESWQEQFIGALYVNGSKEDQESASKMDYVWHLFAIPFKLLFALTPPPSFCNGYPCFLVSLGFIACFTAFMGDAASLFGCVVGSPDEMTAITFVALGTSLPDTFASKTAAVNEPFADASVGNVTGSNSVNVFLGLGLAWTIGTIYWSFEGASAAWKNKYKNTIVPATGQKLLDVYPNGGFHVMAGSLSFSVGVFVSLACVGSIALYVRRVKEGGELGGKSQSQFVSSVFFVLLWVTYITANAWFLAGGMDGLR